MSNRFKDDDDDDAPKKKKIVKAAPRRSALKTVGLTIGGLVGLSAAGVAGRFYQSGANKSFTEGLGFEPGRIWQNQIDGIVTDPEAKTLKGDPLGLIAAGLLASSPHNSQPWRFSIQGNTISVMADPRRNLGSIDPRFREMTIGVGCSIENMVLGASGVGLNPLLNILPDGPKGDTLARLTIYTGVAQPSKEAKALAKRHTNRGAYIRDRAVDSKILDALNALVTTSSTRLVWLKADTEAGKRFAEGTLKATSDFIADKNMVVDSHAWFRFEPGDHRDGLTLPTIGIPPYKTRLAYMLPRGMTGDPHQTWLEMTRDVHLATAPIYGLIAIPALDDRAALIEAGRLWQRLHVQATVMGLAMQPLNQMMEMVDRDFIFQRPSEAERTLNNLATMGSSVFAFGFRMGFSRYITTASPRRGLDDVVVKA